VEVKLFRILIATKYANVIVTYLLHTKMAERQEEGSPRIQRKTSVPKVRTILKQIGDELTADELAKLIFLAGDHIPKGKSQGMNSLNFFSALEEQQLIVTKQGEVDYLVDLLHNLPRADLVKKLKCTQPGSSCTQKVVIHEEITTTDAVMVANESTVEITANSWTVAQDNTDGDFLQDPGLVKSILGDYEEVVAMNSSLKGKNQELELTNVELKKRNHQLEFELNQFKDDQNNLIQQRNSALGAKSEYVFRESELKKELSDLKRTNNLLGKNGARDIETIESQKEEIKELKELLDESINTANELRLELENVKQQKIEVEEELAKVHKTEEDNGRVKCRRCGLIYIEANNSEDACRYHSGQFDVVGSIKKRMEWSCCKNTNKNAPGCGKKKHLTINYPLSPLQVDQQCRKFTM
jgi:hypothetical protein